MRCLAVDPTSRGFCYAVLEGSERLVDWGCSRTASRDGVRFRRRIEGLLERFEPEFLVLEDPDETLRGARAKKRIIEVGRCALKRDIYVETVTRREISDHFHASGRTKCRSRWRSPAGSQSLVPACPRSDASGCPRTSA